MSATGPPWGAYVITSGDAVAVARAACRAGALVIQYRNKRAPRRAMLEQARQIRVLTREAGALLIINDLVDLALVVEADGVHLGQDDLPLREALAVLGDAALIGISTHSLAQARRAEAEGADYIGIGPVYGTPTKPDYQPIGLKTVREVVAAVRIPVVAIGGIDLDNLAEVAAAGARNVAMVRGFAEQTAQRVARVNAELEL